MAVAFIPCAAGRTIRGPDPLLRAGKDDIAAAALKHNKILLPVHGARLLGRHIQSRKDKNGTWDPESEK